MRGTSSISAAARGRWGRGEEEAHAKTEYKLLVLSLLVYLWGSELYNFFPFSPNIVSGVLVVCALALVYLKNLTHSRALMIVACGLMMLYTVAKAEDMAENFNAALRIVTLLMTFWLIADREALVDLSVAVESIHRAVFVTVLVLSALTLLELMLPSCYVSGLEKGGWGEGSFFVGFTRWPHTAASNTVFLFSLNLAYLLNCDFRPAELVLVAIPTLAVLQSGARVYLVPLGVLIVSITCSSSRLGASNLVGLFLPSCAWVLFSLS